MAGKMIPLRIIESVQALSDEECLIELRERSQGLTFVFRDVAPIGSIHEIPGVVATWTIDGVGYGLATALNGRNDDAAKAYLARACLTNLLARGA